MKAHAVPFNLAGFSQIVVDYLAGDEALRPFYAYEPNMEAFRTIMEKRTPVDRKVLVDVLKKQYGTILQSNERTESLIQSLLDENTFTVCTGHQLNIFTGPLYTIYKIMSTIKLADTLKVQYPDKQFVPVFWMASEDHDFEEISHTNVSGNTLQWNQEQQGATGKISTTTLTPVLAELKQLLGTTEHGQALYAIFHKAYAGNDTLAAATRALVHELFAEYGLLVLDADDVELKNTFTNVMEQDIIHQSHYPLINQQMELLEKQYKTQVHPREINFFYMTENLRERIVCVGDGAEKTYKVLNTPLEFTETEIRKEIQEHPERFSPNVVMRPLYQECILPNLAYIGGPAEVAYWLELKSTFEYNHIAYPMLLLRNCMLMIDNPTAAKIHKHGLDWADLFLSIDDIVKKVLKKQYAELLVLTKQKEELQQIFNVIEQKAQLIDVTLQATVKAQAHKGIQSIEKIETKLVNALKRKESDTLRQLQVIKAQVFPNGMLQERQESFIPFYLNQGAGFFTDIYQHMQAIPLGFTILVEEA